jgi:hypothetical protein
LIKLGKICAHSTKQFSTEELKIIARGQGISAGLHIDVPLYSHFAKRLEKLGQGNEETFSNLRDKYIGVKTFHQYKIKRTNKKPVIDTALAMEDIEQRYGIEESEIKEFVQLLQEIENLPAFIHHPLLYKLREVDYG